MSSTNLIALAGYANCGVAVSTGEKANYVLAFLTTIRLLLDGEYIGFTRQYFPASTHSTQ